MTDQETIEAHFCESSKEYRFDPAVGHYVGGDEICGQSATQKDWCDRWICDECHKKLLDMEFSDDSEYVKWREAQKKP